MLMYEPDDLIREFRLREDICETLARERADTPLEQELRDLVRQAVTSMSLTNEVKALVVDAELLEAKGAVSAGVALDSTDTTSASRRRSSSSAS
jgi:hypothetical protein